MPPSPSSDLSEWTPRPRPEGRLLEGRWVRLEPLDWARHSADLFSAIDGPGNESLWRYIPFGPFGQRADFEKVFEIVRSSQGWETQVVVDPQSEKPLGFFSFMAIREAHGSVEIGCVVFSHALQRTRAATEALYLSARHVFEDLGYRRYEWKCNSDNAASKRAALRFGFRYEGLFRNHQVSKGKNRDTAWYAMIDSEWPAIRDRYEAWLDASNFDAAGRQKRPLRTRDDDSPERTDP